MQSPENKHVMKKRPGTTDFGKDYEHLYISNLILKLILDANVENFYLSSNDGKFGSFDDVVVEIRFQDGTNTLFAIQLKHVNKETTLMIEKLNAPKGDCSIKKYYDDYNKNLKMLNQQIKMVLLTNQSMNTEKKDQLVFGKLLLGVKHEQMNFISNSRTLQLCHMVEINKSSSSIEQEEFFNNFYLCTDQVDVRQLEEATFKMFNENYGGDRFVFNAFVHFVTQWSMKEGNKEKLDKVWMERVVALCVFSFVMEPLIFTTKTIVNSKAKFLKEAVGTADATILDNDHYEKIKNIWADAIEELDDIDKATYTSSKYQILSNRVTAKEDLYNGDIIEVNKLMWLLGKCPLVVRACPQVYRTVPSYGKNVIIIEERKFQKATEDIKNDVKTDQRKIPTFGKLSDLCQDQELYEKFLENFSYSIEGQKECPLKNLLDICPDFKNSITANTLVDMLDGPLSIGRHREVLPPSHIERKLTKTLIRFRFLRTIDENTIVVVSGVKNYSFFQRHLPQMEVSRTSDTQNGTHSIYVCRNNTSDADVDSTYTKILHFKYVDENHLEWVRSECSTDSESFRELDKFRVKDESKEHVVDEKQLFDDSKEDITIVCANPGMGKSTLMKSLKNNSDSFTWIIVIHARNHGPILQSSKLTVDKFKKYILDHTECGNEFEKSFFAKMMEINRMQLVWDGLDEVSETRLEAILTLIQMLSKNGVKQWLTSRIYLRDTLERRLGAFSRNITEFAEIDQQEYLKNRLNIATDELSVTFSKIKNNIITYPNYEILGIPLQIYMLTEIILQDRESYLSLLDDVFTVRDLYEYFVDAKFNILEQERRSTNLAIDENYERFQNEKRNKMSCYKCVAANVYIYNSYPNKLFSALGNRLLNYNKEVECFLTEIINKGDRVGLISRVVSHHNVEFSHNSYGEYLTALYIFENCPSKVRDKKFISNDRYNNIRFFLDLMLCKNSKGFVAIIYKNPSLLEKCSDECLREKDEIGRSMLEVACAYSPATKIPNLGNNFLEDFTIKEVPSTDDLNHAQISESFCKIDSTGGACIKKLFLFLPFLIPLYIQNDFSKDYASTVLYYAFRSDVDAIFECIKLCPSLQQMFQSLTPQTVLSLAICCNSKRILSKLLLEQEYRNCFYTCLQNFYNFDFNQIDDVVSFVLYLNHFRQHTSNSEFQDLLRHATKVGLVKTLRVLIELNVSLNIKDKSGWLPIYHACHHGRLDILKLLITNGARIDIPDGMGRLPIHYACRGRRNCNSVLEYLLKHGARLDIPDANGQLPIHVMCSIGSLDTTEFLVAKGARIDVPDTDGSLPIHHACGDSWASHSVVEFLLEQGARTDVPDDNGILPIHLVCKNNSKETLKVLLANDAKLDIPDASGLLPIHHVCANICYGSTSILNLIISKDPTTNILDAQGRSTMHLACKEASFGAVKLLVSKGCRTDVPDVNGRFPIHYACQNWVYGDSIISFLINQGESANVADVNGQMPMHIACANGSSTVGLLARKGAKMDVADANDLLPIHYAYENSMYDITNINILLRNGVRTDVPDREGRLPIHYVCEKGFLDIVLLLVSKGNKRDAADSRGCLPMHYACKNAKYGKVIVEYLIKKRERIDIPDMDGQLPIHVACEYGSLNIVKLLLAKGARTDIPDSNGRLPIHLACRKPSLDIVKFLLVKGARTDIPDANGRLPIHLACGKASFEVVKLLVTKGKSFDSPDANGDFPIHYAFEYVTNCIQIVEYLTNESECINLPGANGHYPIHLACEKSSLNVVKFLVSRGAVLDCLDSNGRLPIHYAWQNLAEGRQIVKYLVHKGQSLTLCDDTGRLPIHFACRYGSLLTVQILVGNGARTDIPDADGWLPMHFACENVKFGDSIVEYLIIKGEKTDVGGKDGLFPMHVACGMGRLEVVKLLVRSGARVYATSTDGRLPIHYAYEWRRRKVVSFLLKEWARKDVFEPNRRSAILSLVSETRSLDYLNLVQQDCRKKMFGKKVAKI